jgi:hypothetical protein
MTFQELRAAYIAKYGDPLPTDIQFYLAEAEGLFSKPLPIVVMSGEVIIPRADNGDVFHFRTRQDLWD